MLQSLCFLPQIQSGRVRCMSGWQSRSRLSCTHSNNTPETNTRVNIDDLHVNLIEFEDIVTRW
jgi:hypothetical protein